MMSSSRRSPVVTVKTPLLAPLAMMTLMGTATGKVKGTIRSPGATARIRPRAGTAKTPWPTSADESRAHLRASNRHDAWDVLPLIQVPTLVLHGTDDLMVPSANAPLLTGRIPGAVMHLHEGGRHGFFDEFAGDIVPVIDDFLLG